MTRMPGLFVTGTDTEVGKTRVACLIARQLRAAGCRVGAYKPVASGCEREGGQLVADDARQLARACGLPEALERVCPQCFAAPLAPPLAARAEGRHVDEELLVEGLRAWEGHCDLVIVEGAGGLMSPLSEDLYVADVALALEMPLVVVAPNTLGVINQTLQTLITAATFREGLEVAGVVLNTPRPPDADDPSRASNLEELERRCGPPVLGELAYGGDTLDRPVDWRALAAR